jgi:uncharacterized protein (DUF488 family)
MLLQLAGGSATSLQVTKWAFLLSSEMPSRGGKSFYRFIPYRYGPFSFTLFQETDSLIRNGFLEKKADNQWALTSLGKKLLINLPKDISQDICRISEAYGKMNGAELIDLIYDKYSWFTINSDLPKRRKGRRPIAQKSIYTAGYEGKTVDEFLGLLLESGVTRLIDVRFNPISRRYGFHKSTLLRLCSALTIDYQHLPGLGIPGSDRRSLEATHEKTQLFESYYHSLPSREEDVDFITSLLKTEPSVLVCMEANPEACHRNVLANYLSPIINMPIIHLGL